MTARLAAPAIAFAALAALRTPPLPAQEPSDTVRLREIVVTATRTSAPRDQVANAVTVLTGEELRARGITRVAEALREVPGAAIVQSGPPGGVTSLFLRGGESNMVRVLVDGVPANQPGGSIDLANLTTDDVDRIEIVRGPVSALFGSDAVTGVVQIFTRRGGTTPAAASVEALGSGAGSSFTASLRGGAPSGRVGYSIFGSRLDEAGVYALNNRFRNWSVGGLLYAAPGPRTDMRLSVRHGDGVYHYPTDFTGDPTDQNQFTSGQLTTLSLDAGHVVARAVELRLLAGASAGVDRAVNPPDSANDVSAYASRTEYGRRSADVRANVHVTPGATLTTGLAVERERFWSSSDSTERTRSGGALYGQLLVVPAGEGRVALTAGARAERNDRFGRFATGRLGVVVRAGAGTLLRLSAGTAFNEPTFLENYGGGFATGNPNLAPERSRSAEVGIEQRLAGGIVVVTATAFAQRFESLIQYTSSVPSGQPNYLNVAGATARGLETEARVALDPATRVGAEWTWLHTAVTDSGVDGSTFAVGRPLLRRPAHSGALTVSRDAARVELSARLIVVGRREDLDYDPVTFAATRVKLRSYERLDLGGSLTLVHDRAGRPLVSALLRLENALDARYQEVLHYPARGRTVWIGLRAGAP